MILDGSKSAHYPHITHNDYAISFHGDSIYIEGKIVLNGCDHSFRVRMIKWDPILKPPNTGDWGFKRNWHPHHAGKTYQLDETTAAIDDCWSTEDFSLVRTNRAEPSSSAKKKFVLCMNEYIKNISKEDWFISMADKSKIIEMNNELMSINTDIRHMLNDLHKLVSQADDIKVKLLLEQKCLGV